MAIMLNHSVEYDFDKVATVSEVAATLIANEKLLLNAIDVLEGCVDGLEINNARVSLKSVVHNSPLKELLGVTIFLTYQKDLEKQIPEIVQALTGMDVPDNYHTLITVLVMLVAVYGIDALWSKIEQVKSNSNTQRKYDELITIVGKELGVSKSKIKSVLDDTLGKGRKRAVVKAARDFFSPAQRYKARAIKGPNGVEIGRDVIAEVPTDIELEEFTPEQDSYTLSDVEIEFHAHDYDKSRQGWAAIIREISDNRKPLHIDPTINRDDLFQRKHAKGDITVITEKAETGAFITKLYYLSKVHL